MINDKDQEQIYKLYEDFRGIELSQPSNNLRSIQSPNYNHTLSYDPTLSTTPTWRGVNSPEKTDRLREDEENYSFAYKLKSSQDNEVFKLLKISNDICELKSSKRGIIEVPLEKFKHLFEEI
jgi:hypothetical protein